VALLSIAGLCELLAATSPTGHVSTRRADQITRRPGFPEPVQRLPWRVWDEDTVKTWIAENRRPLDEDSR
jgi:hypothetical protein